jgi:hypothetical protein
MDEPGEINYFMFLLLSFLRVCCYNLEYALCVCSFDFNRLARTIKRTRWMNLIPYHSKLHPKLRYSSLNPLPDREGLGLLNPIALAAPVLQPSSSELTAFTPDRAVPLSRVINQTVDVALAEIAALSGAGKP